MFDIFKQFTLEWWQAGIFKAALLSIGALLALYFPKPLKKLKPLLWIVAIACTLYIVVVWYGQ